MEFIGEDALDTHTYIFNEGCLQIYPPSPPLLFFFFFAPPDLFFLDCVKLVTWKVKTYMGVYVHVQDIQHGSKDYIIYFLMFLVILLIFLSFCHSDFNIVFLLRKGCIVDDVTKKKSTFGTFCFNVSKLKYLTPCFYLGSTYFYFIF